MMTASNWNYKIRSILISLTAFIVCLIALLICGGRVHAAPISAATFPNPAASTNGAPMYMTIGFGDFDIPYGAAFIMSDTAGTITVSIDEAQFCNVNSKYSTRSLDLPVSTQFAQAYFRTLFEVRTVAAAGDLALPAKNSVMTNNYTSTCADRTLSFTFTLTAADLDTNTGKYVAVFVARPASINPAYASKPTAAENSFRFTVSGTTTARATFLPYNVAGLGNLFNISNRNRAANSSEGYSIDFTPGCTVGPTAVGISFYDADYLLYQSTGAYPVLTYSFSRGNVGGPANTTLLSGGIDGLDGKWWPGPASNNYLTSTIDGAHSYNLTIKGLSFANALSYAINLPTAALDPSPCPPVDTSPTITIAQNCNAPYTAVITVNDADYATNGSAPLINYSLNGGAPVTVRARSYAVTMPSPTTAFYIYADTTGVLSSPPGGDGAAGAIASASNSFGPCTYPFALTSQPQPPALDDPELPTQATSTPLIGFSGTAAVVNGVSTTRDYFRNRGGTYNAGTGTVVGGVNTPLLASAVTAINVSGKPNDGTLGTTTIPGINGIIAADSICVRLTLSPATGWVNAAGVTQPGSGGSSVRVQCTTIVNRPYLKVYGSDIMAGSGFGANCSAKGSDVFGYAKQLATAPKKWVGAGTQLGVFAGGIVNMFASSSVISPSVPSAKVFANNLTTGTAVVKGSVFGGGYDSTFCDDDFWATKATSVSAVAGAVPTLSTLASGQYQYNPGATISSAPADITNRVAIYVDGDITINTNIKLSTAGAAAANSLPSFYVIVRGNIYIAPGVTQLDGVYVAQPRVPVTTLGTPADGGRIFTCTDAGPAPTAAALTGACITNKLTVNGSFSATRINFLRGGGSLRGATAGELGTSANIAEVFNFLPESLLGVPAPKVTETGLYDSVISLPPGL